MSAPLPKLLLVQPQFLVRRTVAAAARELRLAEVLEATQVEAAATLLEVHPVHALLVDLDDLAPALAWMQRVRANRPALPLAAMAGHCTPDTAQALKTLALRRLLLKPFKVKDALETVRLLCA